MYVGKNHGFKRKSFSNLKPKTASRRIGRGILSNFFDYIKSFVITKAPEIVSRLGKNLVKNVGSKVVNKTVDTIASKINSKTQQKLQTIFGTPDEVKSNIQNKFNKLIGEGCTQNQRNQRKKTRRKDGAGRSKAISIQELTKMMNGSGLMTI